MVAAALAAATVLPVQSEVVLIPLLLAQHHPAWLLVLAASLGNTLGSAVNWGLGRLLARFEHQPWFPVRRAAIARAEAWYRRYGRWSLLLSWLPVIGDPLTIVAGVLARAAPGLPAPGRARQDGPLPRRGGHHPGVDVSRAANVMP